MKKLFTTPPLGIRLVLGIVALASLLKAGGYISHPWTWILAPIFILIGILVLAFIVGFIFQAKNYKRKVNFWESFYSRNEKGEREDFTKWM